MGLMKNIDVKSLLIGTLATALLFACADADKTSPSIVSEAKAATGVLDKWAPAQQWEVQSVGRDHGGAGKWLMPEGWEPFTNKGDTRTEMWVRRRIR